MDAVIVTKFQTVGNTEVPVEALSFTDNAVTWHRMIVPAESVVNLPPHFTPADYMFKAVLN